MLTPPAFLLLRAPLIGVQGASNAVHDDDDDIGEDEINDGRIKFAARCGGRVFDAERIAMDFGHYHKKCLSCAECTRVSLKAPFKSALWKNFSKV